MADKNTTPKPAPGKKPMPSGKDTKPVGKPEGKGGGKK